MIRLQRLFPARMRLARLRAERGASAVEFAIIIPVFFALVLGMFSGGQAYDQSLSVTHAVREGARRGVATPLHQYGYGQGAAWIAAVKAVTEERANGDLTVAGASVCVAVVSGAGTVYNPLGTQPFSSKSDGSACFNDGGADTSYRVQVYGERPAYIDVALVRMHIKVSSRAVGKIETQPV